MFFLQEVLHIPLYMFNSFRYLNGHKSTYDQLFDLNQKVYFGNGTDVHLYAHFDERINEY